MLEIADGAAIEPEVDLSGYWIDGDTVRVGGIRIGAGATIGTRSTLAPGTRIGRNAEIAPGSAVFGRSEEHTSELQSLMRISYAVFCLKKKKNQKTSVTYRNISIKTNSNHNNP